MAQSYIKKPEIRARFLVRDKEGRPSFGDPALIKKFKDELNSPSLIDVQVAP